MAKALFGHLAVGDPRMAQEIARLRSRVAELEASLVEVRAERDALMADGVDRALIHLADNADRALAQA